MPEITIYTKKYCGYCRGAKRLLAGKGLAFREIDVTWDPVQWTRMVDRSRRITVPQVFVDDHSIGGYDDLVALDRSGKLDQLVNPTAA